MVLFIVETEILKLAFLSQRGHLSMLNLQYRSPEFWAVLEPQALFPYQAAIFGAVKLESS